MDRRDATEDALAVAFERALTRWPEIGAPENPEAWLLTVARRELFRGARRRRVERAGAAEIARAMDEAAEASAEAAPFPDRRLGLLLACARPEIDAALHAPLMLQTVLGLTAAEIGSAFLTPAATMGQRLSRAKAKIRALGLAFEAPGPEALSRRLEPAL